MTKQTEWDAFISHASEDKDHFVRPLVEALSSMGASVWYDEFTLKIGDSLSQSIDKGLGGSRFGIVVISPHFMTKGWTQHELRGLVTREVDGHSRILPIWHNVTKQQVSNFSPTLADKVAARTADASATEIALQILNAIRPDLYEAQPRTELQKSVSGKAIAELEEELASLREQLSEFQCPYCSSQLVGSIETTADPEEKHWDVVRTFECGYRDFGGMKQSLCHKDPAFPAFEEYEISVNQFGGPSNLWTCLAKPKTDNARLVSLAQTVGLTPAEAKKRMIERYEVRAKPWLKSLGEEYS